MTKTPIKGKVVSEGGKYFVVAEGTRRELAAHLTIGEGKLKDLVGQDVEVLFSEPQEFPVALKLAGRPPILCYRPVFDPADIPSAAAIRGVENQVRVNFANELFRQGVISKQVHEQIGG